MSRRSRSFLSILVLILTTLLAAAQASAAPPTWPPSTGLVIGEVVTGGAAAVDEYVELFNAGDVSAALDGLELAYASASGKTVSRKASWADRDVPPGGRVLIANADGRFAAAADATYTGGLSGTGGSVVLRAADGSVIDALSWGTAASEFLEGDPGPAPPAGSSLERKPGGGGDNRRDTNDNAADTVIDADPVAQGSGPQPTPKPTPAVTPKPTPAPTPKPTPAPTPKPTPASTPKPTPASTPTLDPRPTAPPTSTPTHTPGPTREPIPKPTPTPTAAATPTPTATARPEPTPQPSPPTAPIADVRQQAVGSSATVSGTVTVQAGRILGDRTIALQDASAGIAVRLPDAEVAGRIDRGAIVTVTGELADPYGNLELRPASAGDVLVIGSGGLPEPMEVDGRQIAEVNEGRLARLVATLTDIERRDSGALSLTMAGKGGQARVYVHAPISIEPTLLRRGQRIVATGVIGQRASRSGADDGHRIWPRGPADLKVVGGPPSATPPVPPDEDSERPSRPPRVPIRRATLDRTVSIVGVVTSKAGIVDSEGRRVTVQDRSGAILVRYPSDVEPAKVGRTIRATGTVGSWFGARQLEAETAPRQRGKAKVVATRLRRPPSAADESKLVSIAVTIVELERDGDSWRAEARLSSGQRLPIIGLASSRIDADLVAPGRAGRILGIVRPAHPSATDQRHGVAPRSRRDLQLGRIVDLDPADAAAGDTGDGDADPDDDDDGAGTLDGAGATPTTTTLRALPALVGRVVRVGGRVQRTDGRRFWLDDGTAQVAVRITDRLTADAPPIGVGRVVNLIGRVQRMRAGTVELVVADTDDIRIGAAVGVAADGVARGIGLLSAMTAAIPSIEPRTAGPLAGGAPDVQPPADGLVVVLLVSALAAGALLLAAAASVGWRAGRPSSPPGDGATTAIGVTPRSAASMAARPARSDPRPVASTRPSGRLAR